MNSSTTVTEFYLNAIFFSAKSQIIVFVVALLMYLLAVFGNLLISSLVCLVSQLQTPMYFFLCCLAVQDILYISVTMPKLLTIIVTGDNRISFVGCVTQIFFYRLFTDADIFLLTSMAYDRYVDICIPLHYSHIINKRTCGILTATAWVIGFLDSFMCSMLTSNLSFCHLQEIDNFFCDIQTVLQLSCSDATYITTLVIVECVILGWIPFVLILSSYINIISTVLKIKTTNGRIKVFSSCSSHLIVVIIFYFTCLSMNMKTEHYPDVDKFLSLLYIAVVPTLNPLVYSLRNGDVLKAIKKVYEKSF